MIFAIAKVLQALKAWEKYDATRGEYEALKDSWDAARTSEAANRLLPKAIEARDEYEKALSELRQLGYYPSGIDPIPPDYFKGE